MAPFRIQGEPVPRLDQLLKAACTLTVALHLTQCTQPSHLERCANETEGAIGPDSRISECSAVIDSRNVSKDDLVVALTNRGFAYRKKGAPQRAIQDYDRAIRLKPDYAQAFLNRGVAYMDGGDHDRAIQDFEQAMRFKRGFGLAFLNRGIAFAHKAELDRAVDDLTQATSISPDLPEAFGELGAAYERKGEHERAIQALDRAIRLKPDYALAFYNRGVAYAGKGDDDRAIGDYTQSIRINPDFVLTFVNRSNLYYKRGEYDRAIEDLDQVIRLKPDSEQAYNNRCWARAVLNTALEIALSDCNAALRLEPATALDSRGFVYLRLGQYEKAINDCTASLDRNPESAATLYVRGLAKLRNGDSPGGERDIAAAAALDAKISDTFARFPDMQQLTRDVHAATMSTKP
jgi:tetratricopeptide (TPR) repeat protein